MRYVTDLTKKIVAGVVDPEVGQVADGQSQLLDRLIDIYIAITK